VERATGRQVCLAFAAALIKYGIPDEALTDNGKQFTGRFGRGVGEVLFDKICRHNGITHRLTQPASPTTTGKIERFHGTARRELLNQTVFDSKAHAQQVIAAWVAEYNTDRPHQSLGRATPAQRFTTTRVATADAGPPLRLTTLAADRGGEDWVTRRVASNGVISVAWQQVSVGKHRGGEVVDIHVRDRLLEVWSGNDLIRSIARDHPGPIRKRRAARPTT
jgi:hypothetical protein